MDKNNICHFFPKLSYTHTHTHTHTLFLTNESESRPVMSDSLRPHGLLTVQGILQARILEWVAFPFSRGSSQPRDQTQVSHIAGGFFTSWATGEAQLSNQGRYLIIKSTMKHSQLFLLNPISRDTSFLPKERKSNICNITICLLLKMRNTKYYSR